MDAKWIEKFWSRVDIGGCEDCWVWIAGKSSGYGKIKLDGKTLTAHRVSFILDGNSLTDDQILDHVCHNRSCVNPLHLRVVSPEQNQHNRGLSKNNTSGYKNVTWNKTVSKWVARIGLDGKRIFLGYFHDKDEAYRAYVEAAKKLHGIFCRTK